MSNKLHHHAGHSHHGHMHLPAGNANNDTRYRETVRVTLVGSAIDLLLGVAKIIVGFTAHSQALIADGIHSLSDLGTDVMVLVAAKHAGREADAEHPYGHGRFETIATVGLGVALIGVACGITYDAIQRLFQPDSLLHPGPLALGVAAASVISKEAIYHYTMRAAKKYRSDMLRANAWHSRSDAISSVIVIVGVAGTMAGLNYLDAVAAVAVALMVAKIGWDLSWHSIHELVDTGLEKERVETIAGTIRKATGVRDMHMLRTRRMGGDALVDVHIQVEPTLSVSEGHHIGETVRSKVIREIEEVADVTVHVDTEDDQSAAASKLLPLRPEIIQRLGNYFRDLDAARSIERITLHYMNGKVNVELILPITLANSEESADALNQAFQHAVSHDPDIGTVLTYFH